MNKIDIYDGVAVSSDPEGVTVRITGEAFANLKKIAQIVTRYEGETDAALVVARDLVNGDWWESLSARSCDCVCQNLPTLICDRLDGNADLVHDFRAAGFHVSGYSKSV